MALQQQQQGLQSLKNAFRRQATSETDDMKPYFVATRYVISTT